MHLENVVFDAVDPRTVGRFWEAALGTEPLTDEQGGYETRLAVPDGPVIDLCFQRVAQPPVGPQRIRLDLRGGAATDTEQALTDPEGNPYRLLARGAADVAEPLVAISLAVAEPEHDQDFWSWLTGWVPSDIGTPRAVRHPSQRGPRLELTPETEPKGEGKNRVHLDVRLDAGEDPDRVALEIARRGGRELHFDWGELPLRHFADPSGNEFCVLPAPA